MQVITETVRKWATELPEEVVDKNGIENKV